MNQLLPGLPDDVALQCLIRLPFDSFAAAASVNHQWSQFLRSPLFDRLRSSGGLAQPLLALAQANNCTPSPNLAKETSPSSPSSSLSLFEPKTGRWARLPSIPGFPSGGLPLFCRLAAVGRHLVVVGGWDPLTWAASDRVHVYDFLTAAWRPGARMPGPRRSFFACAASAEAGLVLVAGGHDEDKNALRSALAYHVARDEWAPLADMARERDECHGALLRGGLHVIGGYATDAQGQFSASAEAFDAATWRWGPVVEGVSADATCVAAGPAGSVFKCVEGGHVLVSDDGMVTWRKAIGEVPVDVRVGTQLMVCDKVLVVIGTAVQGGPLAGYVAEMDDVGRATAWRKAEVPDEFSGHVQASCCFTL